MDQISLVLIQDYARFNKSDSVRQALVNQAASGLEALMTSR